MKIHKLARRVAGRNQLLRAGLLMEARQSLVDLAWWDVAAATARMAAWLEELPSDPSFVIVQGELFTLLASS